MSAREALDAIGDGAAAFYDGGLLAAGLTPDAVGTCFVFRRPVAGGHLDVLVGAGPVVRRDLALALRPAVCTGPRQTLVADAAVWTVRDTPAGEVGLLPFAALQEQLAGAGREWTLHPVTTPPGADLDPDPTPALVVGLAAPEAEAATWGSTLVRADGDVLRLAHPVPDRFVGAPVLRIAGAGAGRVTTQVVGLVTGATVGLPLAALEALVDAVLAG